MVNSIGIVCPHCGEQPEFFDKLIWLSTKEAAAYLRISIGSLKNRIYRGEVFPKKFGKLNRFLKKDLDRLVGVSNERR